MRCLGLHTATNIITPSNMQFFAQTGGGGAYLVVHTSTVAQAMHGA
jgi:hypothetical protein